MVAAGEHPLSGNSDALPVCVVIPAFERADLLPRAVASVRAQTRPPAEIVVVDDHSSDDTPDVLRELGVRTIRHDRNQGESAARNSGIAATEQPWVALLDSDDEWLPEHLERVFALRDGHVLVADAALGRGSRPEDHRVYGVVGPGPKILAGPADVAFPFNCVAPSAVLLRRETVLAAGGFDSAVRLCADLDLWLRMLERGPGVAAAAVGAIYHVHEGQVSADDEAMQRAHRAVLERYRDREWCSDRLLLRYEGVTAWDAFRRAQRARSPRAAARALVRLARRPESLRGAVRLLVLRRRLRQRVAPTRAA